MRRFWMMLIVVALALTTALAAGAKKPDKPGNPGTGFKPVACQVDDAFRIADVWNADGISSVWADESRAFTLIATELGGYNETRYIVEPGSLELDDVMCMEVRLVEGTLGDLRVRWLDCQDCGLFRASGKNLRNFNNGDVFSAGVSVADWTDPGGEKTVAVMPNPKSGTVTMKVKVGIDQQP